MENDRLYDEQYEYNMAIKERRKRIRFAIVVLPLITATFLILFKILFPEQIHYLDNSKYYFLYNLMIFASIGVSTVGLLMNYLQTGFRNSPFQRVNPKSNERLFGTIYDEFQSDKNNTAERLDEFARLISELSSQTKNVRPESSIMTDDEKQEIILKIKEDLRSQVASDTYSELIRKIESDVKEDVQQKFLASSFRNTLDRLSDEVSALTRRGSLNLSLGIITTITGLIILGYFIVNKDIQGTDFTSFSVGFFPRISLVVLIEVFAYFFLRLYKASLSEIKYFQNEMTNVEAKYVALFTAIESSDNDTQAVVVKSFSATERNHVLEKGQTTVELEKSKADKEEINNLVKTIAEMIKNQK